MMTENEIRAAYRQDAERAAGEVTKTQRLIYRTGTLRLLLFGGAVAAVIGLWGQGALMYAVTAACLLPFLLLVKYHNRLFLRKDYQENGPRSLFQYVNRTCTRLGREQLARWMACHLDKQEPILRRQEAVQELAAKPSFRQHFRILGLLNKGQAADRAELLEWAQSPVRYRNRGLLRRLPRDGRAASQRMGRAVVRHRSGQLRLHAADHQGAERLRTEAPHPGHLRPAASDDGR